MRIVTAFLLLIPALLMADAFRYVDPKTGEIVFTDKPPASQQADKIKIESPSVATPYPVPPVDSTAPDRQQVNETIESSEPAHIKIVSPTNEETFRNIGGKLKVTVSLSNMNNLKQFEIRYILDGKVASISSSLSTTLENVYRGTHSISAELVSGTGKVIAAAEPHSFQVHQTSQ